MTESDTVAFPPATSTPHRDATAVPANGPEAIAWTSTPLAVIDRADEIEVTTRRSDGSLRAPRIVWVVRHGDSLYVRSVNGPDAAWYRGVRSVHAGEVSVGAFRRPDRFVEAGDHVGEDTGLDDALDEAYRVKYRRWSGPVAHITAEPARATTLRIDPA